MADLHRDAPKIEVRLDGLKSERFHVVSIHRGIGGSSLDHARLTFDKAGRRDATLVKDTQLGDFEEIGSEIEITLITGEEKRCLHWGKIAGFHWANGERSGETIEFMSRLESHHFGEPLWGVFYRAGKAIDWGEVTWPAGLDAQTLWVDEPLVFNPEIDGVVYGNMSPKTHALGFNYFLHPDSIKSISAAVDAIAGKHWTLARAVFYLCGVLNAKEKWLTNPTLKELEKVLPADEALLRDFRQIRYGDLLPEALDKILPPFGYTWWVDVSRRGTRKIVVCKLGDAAAAIDLKLQAAGATLDPDKSHVEGLSLTYDTAARMANDICCVGDYWAVEATFELVPAWSKDYDALYPSTDLNKSTANYQGSIAYQRVWRDWVLNEAGDYIGLRPSITKPYDLSTLGPVFNTRRRRFHPCISENAQGSPFGDCHGVLVEWWDKYTSSWKKLDEIHDGARHVTLLRHECGIRFDGEEVPMELNKQHEAASGSTPASLGAKVRVTATLISDERIAYRKFSWPGSVCRDPKQLLIECSGYQKRQVHKTSVLAGVAPKSSAIDETPQLKLLARELHKASDRAIIGGQIILDGLEKKVELGKTLRKLDGRKVLFQATSSRAPYKLYPTIVGITYQIDAQQTILQLDTLLERPRV